MKTISKRAYAIFLFIGAFVLCFGVYGYDYITGYAKWVVNPANRHLHSKESDNSAGTIYDRDGLVLAATKDGERTYSSDVTTRKALLHVVGDRGSFISTSVSYIYRTQLMGYNIFDGTYQAQQGGKGNDMYLTVSSRLSARAYELMDGRKGAVCMYNYKTGEVLVLMSTPTFDPDNKPKISDDSEKYRGVYYNRAISMTYPPGSTFKLVTTAAAINNISDIDDWEFDCNGSYKTPDGLKVNCPREHGHMDFKQALAQSCNGAYARMALEITGPVLEREAKKMGFGKNFSVGEIPVRTGSVGMADATPNELGYSAIGQYTDEATPLQMMLLAGAVANGGASMQPYLVASIKTQLGVPMQTTFASRLSSFMPLDTADKLKEMMKYNVEYKYGRDEFNGLDVGGKTGTAEVGGDKKAHAWFVGFLDDPDHPYAVAVIQENSGAGQSNALPVASKLLQSAVKDGVF